MQRGEVGLLAITQLLSVDYSQVKKALGAYDHSLRTRPMNVAVPGQVICQVTVSCTDFSLKMYEKVRMLEGPMHEHINKASSCIPKRRYVKRLQGGFGPLHPYMSEPWGRERCLAMIGD